MIQIPKSHARAVLIWLHRNVCANLCSMDPEDRDLSLLDFAIFFFPPSKIDPGDDPELAHRYLAPCYLSPRARSAHWQAQDGSWRMVQHSQWKNIRVRCTDAGLETWMAMKWS